MAKMDRITRLLCLQYATLSLHVLYSTTLVLLFEIFQISPQMSPNQIIREALKLLLKIKKLTYQLISPKQLHNFYGKRESCYVLTESRLPQLGNSLQFESYRQRLPTTAAKTELN